MCGFHLDRKGLNDGDTLNWCEWARQKVGSHLFNSREASSLSLTRRQCFWQHDKLSIHRRPRKDQDAPGAWNMCLKRSRFARQTPSQQCRSIGGRFSRSGTLTGASLGHSVQPDWATSSDATKCRRNLVKSTYLTLIWMTALLSSSCGSSKTVISL